MLIQLILWKSAMASGSARHRQKMRWVSRSFNAIYTTGSLLPESKAVRSIYLSSLRKRPNHGTDL